MTMRAAFATICLILGFGIFFVSFVQVVVWLFDHNAGNLSFWLKGLVAGFGGVLGGLAVARFWPAHSTDRRRG